MSHEKREVSVYRGDDIVASGTYEECGKQLGIQARTIQWYTTPTYQRRLAKRKRDNGKRLAVVKLNDDADL